MFLEPKVWKTLRKKKKKFSLLISRAKEIEEAEKILPESLYTKFQYAPPVFVSFFFSRSADL